MKVKLLRGVTIGGNKRIPQGAIFAARKLPAMPFQFDAPYQIIEGPLCGMMIPREECMEVEEERTYTEKEWNDLKNRYSIEIDRLKQQKDQAQQLVDGLTNQLNKKNEEIERLNFFVNVSSVALKASCEAIETLRKKQ